MRAGKVWRAAERGGGKESVKEGVKEGVIEGVMGVPDERAHCSAN